jgi:hypothetical protein
MLALRKLDRVPKPMCPTGLAAPPPGATPMTLTLARLRRAPPAGIIAAPRRGANADIPPLLPELALQATWAAVQERRFATLHAALGRHGGCVPADEVCTLLRPHWDQPLSRVARWIARREVASVAWRGQLWMPLFQFERPSLDLMPVAAEVVRTLRGVYDDWELAEWFARPNDLLGGRCPAARLATDPCAVKEAARIDRFINRW